MGPTIPTPPASSTVTTSSVSQQSPPLRILQLSLISAQDLAPVSKSMRTYALAWVHPNRKVSTRIDQRGRTNPTWDDKFAFRVDDEFLSSENSAVTVEIYTVSWFRDVLVGTVRILIHNLINPYVSQNNSSSRYVALQIRRSSGNPQGILNMGVSLIDSTMKSMPLYSDLSTSVVGCRDLEDKEIDKQRLLEDDDNQDDENEEKINSKIQLWRSLSTGMEINHEDFPLKSGSIVNGSLCNGSIVNESELCSDVGPSASIVAAEIAKGLKPPVPAPPPPKALKKATEEADEGESSILEELTVEEAVDKGLTTSIERWRTGLPPRQDVDWEKAPLQNGGHSRRHSDGGLFSCFGNAYGFEFTIVCGANNSNNNNNNCKTTSNKIRKKRSSEANSA